MPFSCKHLFMFRAVLPKSTTAFLPRTSCGSNEAFHKSNDLAGRRIMCLNQILMPVMTLKKPMATWDYTKNIVHLTADRNCASYASRKWMKWWQEISFLASWSSDLAYWLCIAAFWCERSSWISKSEIAKFNQQTRKSSDTCSTAGTSSNSW